MTHVDVIRALPSATKAKLLARSNRAGLRHLAGHCAALLIMGSYIAFEAPLWGFVLLPYGIMMVFLFTLSHECTHATPFASARLNDLIGHIIALPLLLPFTWFRYFHLAHHKHTNDPQHDPELEHGPRPTTWPDYLMYLSGWGYWRGMIGTLFTNAFRTITAPYLPARKHAQMRREARILLALYALIIFSLLFSPLALWIWIVPVLIGQPVLRLYLLAEHGHCPPVANMLENTRTTLTNRLVRALAWNMPYHAEHHAFPMVPFHQLPALHREIAPHLMSVSDSYTAFTRDYLRELGDR